MPNLMPSNILNEVREVLLDANTGKGDIPQFMTAYQILDRLPDEITTRLISERGSSGKGSGRSYSAASVCSDAAEMLEEIDINYIDCEGAIFKVKNNQILPSFSVCGVYRLRNI